MCQNDIDNPGASFCSNRRRSAGARCRPCGVHSSQCNVLTFFLNQNLILLYSLLWSVIVENRQDRLNPDRLKHNKTASTKVIVFLYISIYVGKSLNCKPLQIIITIVNSSYQLVFGTKIGQRLQTLVAIFVGIFFWRV